MKILLATALAALAAAPLAPACGDGETAANLLATPSVKAGLAAAYAAAHPAARGARPLPGHTWYGSFEGYEYAVATFGDHPSVFSRAPGGRWRLDRDTHGAVCTNVVPLDLLAGTWWYEHWGRNCYLPPR